MCACSGVLQRGTAHDPGRESQWEDRHAGKNASPTLHYQRKRINRAATRKHTETKRITRMDNKAMYLHSFDEKENGSAFEEPYDGRNLSKMNLCDGYIGVTKSVRIAAHAKIFSCATETGKKTFPGKSKCFWKQQALAEVQAAYKRL
ncbi:uncharacterized protein LOC121393758 isoform X2 [Xenopus laevis]|uniref:Uncharacterized protein LOC121393758 isoform X2 n=1 Tax=Xenopus laevis TaxID=8355 RepID=A0A8J1KP58_XENLA|nr:uncharacterized protein LOC121393758 isoform X2 [Xenopus laevis]